MAWVGVPYLTVENTAPEFFWLTNYIETEMSAALWQPITSATTAWRNRTLLDARARDTGADPAAVKRAVSGKAAVGVVRFDTHPGLEFKSGDDLF